MFLVSFLLVALCFFFFVSLTSSLVLNFVSYSSLFFFFFSDLQCVLSFSVLFLPGIFLFYFSVFCTSSAVFSFVSCKSSFLSFSGVSQFFFRFQFSSSRVF